MQGKRFEAWEEREVALRLAAESGADPRTAAKFMADPDAQPQVTRYAFFAAADAIAEKTDDRGFELRLAAHVEAIRAAKRGTAA